MNKRIYHLALAVFAGSLSLGIYSSCDSSNENKDQQNTEWIDHKEESSQQGESTGEDTPVTQQDIPHNAQVLINAYPGQVKSWDDGYIVMADGTKIRWDDGRNKTFVEKLDDGDVEDMFAFKYDRNATEPAFQQDAGRSRCEELFKSMYGHSAAEVERNLVSVDWFGTKVRFTRINGAADRLKEVAADIAELLKTKPELEKFLTSSGTFYWRKVRGANRQSAHSYGIAFDIAVAYSDYWLYHTQDENAKVAYLNKIPMELVQAFERHGFVWGGRWYHYDTMHFEYRPEILMACK